MFVCARRDIKGVCGQALYFKAQAYNLVMEKRDVQKIIREQDSTEKGENIIQYIAFAVMSVGAEFEAEVGWAIPWRIDFIGEKEIQEKKKRGVLFMVTTWTEAAKYKIASIQGFVQQIFAEHLNV